MVLWTVAHLAPLSLEFSRQEYRSGLPFPPPGDRPDLGIKPLSLCVSCIARRILYHGTTWEDAYLIHCSVLLHYKASRLVQLVKTLPAMQEMQVQFPGREDPLEEEMATHSCILAWRIPQAKEPGGL